MPQLHRYPADELPDWIKYQVLSFIRVEWWWIFQRDPYWDYLTQKSTQPVNFVLAERDLVISHAEVNRRVLTHQGQTLNTFGVSAVFTYPVFRRQGYASQVMQEAVDYIDASEADVAMLFCQPPLRDFYTRSGWIAMPTTCVMSGSPDEPVIDEEECLMMRFVSEKGKQMRPNFENAEVYIGRFGW